MDNAGKKPVWSVQPPKGMLKGDYYRIEERFPPYYPGVEGEFPADPGHLGIVEAVKADGKLIFVELNEITAPSYYNHLYQGISKRRSSYSFWQYTKPRMQKAGSVLTMGMQYVEQQMLGETEPERRLRSGGQRLRQREEAADLRGQAGQGAGRALLQEAVQLFRGLWLRPHRLAEGGGGERQDPLLPL